MENTKLQSTPIEINITGDHNKVFSVFLRVFLAQSRLTDKQITVTTSLVGKYAKYIQDGVKEPYASQLLFSTDNRKAVAEEIGISAPHLNNTFISLVDKKILVKDGKAYQINPYLIPATKLVFNFSIENAKQGSNNKGSGTEAHYLSEASPGSGTGTARVGTTNDEESPKG